MADPVVHFEIIGDDGEQLQSFYRDGFGWEVNADNPMKYGYVRFAAGSLTGGISGKWGAGPSYVTIFIGVPDLQAHLDRLVGLGAKVLVPPTEIPGGGSFAHFEDPAGNRIGLFKT